MTKKKRSKKKREEKGRASEGCLPTNQHNDDNLRHPHHFSHPHYRQHHDNEHTNNSYDLNTEIKFLQLIRDLSIALGG